jgi:predicted amidohydrolase YtcJ
MMRPIVAIALLLFAAAPAFAQDTILYRGGPIVTMDGDTPQTVEAVVTRGRPHRLRRSREERRVREAGKDVAVRDLKGATMLPGFIDAHSHFTVATMSAGGLDLARQGARGRHRHSEAASRHRRRYFRAAPFAARQLGRRLAV